MVLGIISQWLNAQHHHRDIAQRVVEQPALHAAVVIAATVATAAATAATTTMGQARTRPTPRREVAQVAAVGQSEAQNHVGRQRALQWRTRLLRCWH